MQKTTCAVAVCGMLFAGGSGAEAQGRAWEGRGYLGVNLGVQPQSHTFTETSTPLIYGERASISVPHTIGGGPLVDVSAGMRVWRNFGVGLGYSRFSSTETRTLTAQIPNPLVFGSSRAATASTGELSHTESALHAQMIWMLPLSDRFDIAAIIGSSFVSVKQDLIAGATPTEGAPPFGSVTLASVETEARSKTAPALTIGADVAYLITSRIGVGGFVRLCRISGGNVDVASPGGEGEVSVSAGGFQSGIGLRVRF